MAKAVTVIKDDVAKVFKSINELVGKQVLVGIPEDHDPREEGGPIGNAGIGYAMEFGMPANNVPARPFLIPGVKKAREASLRALKQASAAALEGNTAKSNQMLEKAGTIASNEVRGMINSNIPPPLKPSTIANRFRQRQGVRGTKSRRESEKVYLDLVRKHGVDPGAAQAETGIISLINTTQLRNSITYVVREHQKNAVS